jgi:hypothetical protein
MLKNLILISSLTALSACASTGGYEDNESTKNAKAQLNKWVESIKSRDADKIVKLYDDEAVLLATFAKDPIVNQKDRLAYFKGLTQKSGLRVKIDKAYYEENGDIAFANGVYTFSYEQGGRTVNVPARFSFVFEHEPDEGWEIESHHSSLVPSGK